LAKECGIGTTTARQWLSLLEMTRVVFLLRPFHHNLTKRVVKHPKLYFTDTGLLAYLLRYPNGESIRTGPLAGAFFENMVVAEFLKRRLNHGKNIEFYFYRDTNGNEVDLVLDAGSNFHLCEIKASQTPQVRHGETLQKVSRLFPNAQCTVLSQSATTGPLLPGVQALPWWRLGECLDFTPAKTKKRGAK
jgi:hypothetical protein